MVREHPRVQLGADPYRPHAGEGAVLSLLAARADGAWHVIAGSLLTTPAGAAATTWPTWHARHPTRDGRHHVRDQLDPGPRFVIEPSADVRALRMPVDAAGWDALVAGLASGTLRAMLSEYVVSAGPFSVPALLGSGRRSDAHRTVGGVSRPVRGTVASLTGPDMPATESTWSVATPPYLRPGRLLGAMHPRRTLVHWPRELLGIDWLAGSEFAPPRRFVIGRLQDEAWIVDMKPDFESAQLHVTIAWNAHKIDPLSCVIGLRQELDDMPLMESSTRISDFPADASDGPEPRTLPWDRRSITVRLSRGLRRVDFGVTLDASDGRRLDERAVAPRVESVGFTLGIIGANGPAHTWLIGDRDGPPTPEEQREALCQVQAMDEQAFAETARQRVSTSADVRKYLRWRFAYRAGELLILDPYLAQDGENDNDLAATLTYLSTLDRSIRALCVRPKIAALAVLPALPRNLKVRWLPTKKALHDRYWTVGETGLHVGASLNHYAADRAVGSGPMFSISELAAADAVAHRTQFETWWTAAGAANTWTPVAAAVP